MPEKTIHERLIDGARILGEMHRKGIKCSAGWGATCSDEESARTKMCKAKLLWMSLLAQDKDRQLPNTSSSYGLLDCMTIDEKAASGITFTVEIEGHGPVKIGPKGEMSWNDYVQLLCNPEAMMNTLAVLKGFPGAKFIELEQPELKKTETPVAVAEMVPPVVAMEEHG